MMQRIIVGLGLALGLVCIAGCGGSNEAEEPSAFHPPPKSKPIGAGKGGGGAAPGLGAPPKVKK